MFNGLLANLRKESIIVDGRMSFIEKKRDNAKAIFYPVIDVSVMQAHNL